MSVILEVNYAKKIGLPGYSSHQYSVNIRTELGDLSQLEKTNAELYARLQTAVDSQIVNAGHLPGETTPTSRTPSPVSAPTTSAPAASSPAGRPTSDDWQCSPKQRELIEKIIRESQLVPANIETLAQERFGTGLRQLNKLQASSLIDELIETHQRQGQRRDRRPAYAGRGRP
jgi:hypothetical protein